MERAERITGGLILLLLLGIVAAVAGYRLRAGGTLVSLGGLLAGPPPAGWEMMGQPEEYPAYRLNEKINGEDIEYLSRGCVGLAWAEYQKAGNTDLLIMVSLYDMASAANAEDIYESARGPGVQPVQIGDEGYTVGGSLYLRAGRYYMQLQATVNDPEVGRACGELAGAIIKRIERRGR